jgi:hypothetical protein
MEVEQIALGPVHWTALDVDVSRLDAGPAAQDHLHAAIESRIATADAESTWLASGDISTVGCSVRFTGATGARGGISEFIAARSVQELTFEATGRRWVVVKMKDATRPRHDLERLGKEPTPLGQLARLLSRLQHDPDAQLPDPLRTALERFDPNPWGTDLERDPLHSDADVARVAAQNLLDALWSQREAQEGP